jgi:hypothetical protein
MVQPSGAIVVGDGRLAAGDAGFTRLLDAHRHAGRNLAELTGNVLEDEEILGTVQWPFGASIGIGGTIEYPSTSTAWWSQLHCTSVSSRRRTTASASARRVS